MVIVIDIIKVIIPEFFISQVSEDDTQRIVHTNTPSKERTKKNTHTKILTQIDEPAKEKKKYMTYNTPKKTKYC